MNYFLDFIITGDVLKLGSVEKPCVQIGNISSSAPKGRIFI